MLWAEDATGNDQIMLKLVFQRDRQTPKQINESQRWCKQWEWSGETTEVCRHVNTSLKSWRLNDEQEPDVQRAPGRGAQTQRGEQLTQTPDVGMCWDSLEGTIQLPCKPGSANQSLWARSGPLSVFINKVLLESLHNHLLTYCLWLLWWYVAALSSCNRCLVAYKA